MDYDELRDQYFELLHMLDDEDLPYDTRSAIHEEMVDIHQRMIAEQMDSIEYNEEE